VILLDDADGWSICCAQLRLLPGGERILILIIIGLEDDASVNWAFEAVPLITSQSRSNGPYCFSACVVYLREVASLQQLEQANQELLQ